MPRRKVEPHDALAHRHIDRGLLIRLAIYYAIGVALVGIVALRVVVDGVSIVPPLLALAAGVAAGTVFSRIVRISWDRGAKKVVSHFDGLGLVTLVLYVAFEWKREEIVEHFVHGPALLATSFALLAGVMAGRLLGMRGRVHQVLEEKKLL